MQLQMLKKALIAYVNSLKTVWSAIAYPLSIVSKRKGKVKDYRIYGNSVQDGTPTPEEPIEVQSMGELITEGEYAGKYKVSVSVRSLNSEIEPQTVNIYLDEPLRKIGDYADIIDYDGLKVVRKIKKETITEIGAMSGDVTTYKRFTTPISAKPLLTDSGTSAKGMAISNKFQSIFVEYKNLGEYGGVIMPYITTAKKNTVALTFTDSRIKTLEKAQSAIGDGFEVCYILSDPIDENLNLPKLPQFKGTTIYEVQTEVPPSGIEVCYYE